MKWIHVLVGVLAGVAAGYVAGKRQCDEQRVKDRYIGGYIDGYEYAESLLKEYESEEVNQDMVDAFMSVFGYVRQDACNSDRECKKKEA